MRVNYDKYGRTEIITDKSLCNFDNAVGSAGKEIVYTNEYSADGRLVSVEIDNGSSIFPKSSLSEATDETGKVISKTISHIGNTKIYSYNYDEYNGEAYPDNRISKINLPNNATVEYSYDVYSRILSRKISPSANYQITENYTYLRGGNCLNCGCRDRETNYVSSIFCQSIGKQVK